MNNNRLDIKKRNWLATLAILLALVALVIQPVGQARAALVYAADNFGQTPVGYGYNDGSVNWAGAWEEFLDNNNPATGNVRITGGELLISSRNAQNDGDDEYIQRPIDLSVAQTGALAMLSFSLRPVNMEGTDDLLVRVTADGTNWVTIDTLDGNSRGWRYYDISAYDTSTAAIRFEILDGGFDNADEVIYIDNVQVSFYTPSSHTNTDVLQTVQTYYLAVPENQALTAMRAINTAAVSPTYVYVSITIVADGTVVYFDHWEDGFEAAVNNPQQDTTDVWGDNDPSNGMPPGYTTDLLNAGDIVILNNPVDTSALSVIDFDGGDKIATTEAVAVTRATWATGSGTLHGGAEELLDISVWGTNFNVPVSGSVANDFEYTGLSVMATKDGTQVYRNGNFVTTLDEGEAYLFNNTVAIGDSITASQPIQATLLTGDIGSNYQSDFFTLYPFDLLSDSYYAPVNSTANSTDNGSLAQTAVFLYNPNASQITVNWTTTAGAQTPVTVNAKSTTRVDMPTTATGAHFYTTNGSVFEALSLIDVGDQRYDWGYTLIPDNQLTQQAKVGWGPGRDPTSATNLTENGSPVWVMPIRTGSGSGSMYVCVDYDGDNLPGTVDANGYYYDVRLTLNHLQQFRVYDPDGDQTGMLVYLCNGTEDNRDNKLAVAWGQDPATASTGYPGLDVGTTVPPLPDFTAIKGAELIIDLNGNTRFDVRDTFAYIIEVQNSGALPIAGNTIEVTDIIPQYTTYVPGSTTYYNGSTTVSIPDDSAPETPFPLDGTGFTIPHQLPIEGVFEISFQVKIDPSLPSQTTIQNSAQVSGLDLEYNPQVDIVVLPPQVTNAIGNRVWIDENGDGLQDPGEPGLANVIVELYDSIGTTLLATAVTDANGGYLFTGLESDTYQVQVRSSSLPGALSISTLGTAGQDFNNQAQPYTITLGGQENLTADFGYNWAPAANVNGNSGTGAIGDRLWIDADGNGLQDPGEPGLGNVPVTILYDPDGDGVFDTPFLGAFDQDGNALSVDGTLTTAPDGAYAFTGLPVGSYVIQVNGGSDPVGYSQSGDPDSSLDNRSEPLVLAPGDVYLNADFGYQPDSAGSIGSRVWFNPDGDANLDTGEYGLPGISVALVQDSNGNGIWDSGEAIIATDITDADGLYSFAGLPLDDGGGDAAYLVWVNDSENYLGELDANYDADGLNTPGSGLATSNLSALSLSPGSPTNLNQNFGYGPVPVNLAQSGVIGDTVFLDRNGNGTFDLGEGLENVDVEIYNTSGDLITYTRTSEAGFYSFGGLADGTYTIKVVPSTLPGAGSGLSNSIDPDTVGTGDNQSSVTLSAGNRINLLQDFGYIASTPNTLGGTIWEDRDADGVLDESNAGLAGVTVALLDADGNLLGTTTTDANGDYTFSGLPDGDYRVHVLDQDGILNGYWHAIGPDAGDGSTDNNSQSDPYAVSLSGGETHTLADFGYYREPASLGEVVWDDLDGDGIQDDGEPGLPGVQVTLTVTYPGGAGSLTLVTTTDANGYYSFDNLLLDEDYDGAGTSGVDEPAYQISFATPAGYQASPTDQGGDDSADSDGTSVNNISLPAQGQSNDTVDCGFYQVSRIGDTIWNDINANGLQDEPNAGIAGLRVYIDSNGNDQYDVGEPFDITDADGAYEIVVLASGAYTLRVDTTTVPAGLTLTYDEDSGTSSPDG
ncbi:MAG: carboxypeptidase regulatory-like domain-containing protein, partial [Anaerolineales bacterium]|nr:carboxypeptidase regulatory-like domain-containing protein [Anaerolineales bacterium]